MITVSEALSSIFACLQARACRRTIIFNEHQSIKQNELIQCPLNLIGSYSAYIPYF